MSLTEPARVVFELRLVGRPGTAGIHDLRALLKRLLRQHGFGYAATREAAMAAFAISWRRE